MPMGICNWAHILCFTNSRKTFLLVHLAYHCMWSLVIRKCSDLSRFCVLTFQEACLARELLDNDREWWNCLEEVSIMQIGSRLWGLFATILLFCNPLEPKKLWEEFWPFICDDLLCKLCCMGFLNLSLNDIYNYSLYLINKILKESGKSLKDFAMPQPICIWADVPKNPLISEQLNYNTTNELEHAAAYCSLFNNKQQMAFEQITWSIDEHLG